jgi:hypothetical protein
MPRVLARIGFWRVRVKGFGIGAALGIERRFDFDHASPQALDHRLDHVVAADSQAFGHDLGRQMAVTQMPGDPNQMLRVVAADFGQRLGRSDHLDQPAIVEHQRIATTQRDRIFQVEQKRQPARAGHGHPPPVPVVEAKHDGIGGRLAPAVLPMDLGRPDHDVLTASRPCRR